MAHVPASELPLSGHSSTPIWISHLIFLPADGSHPVGDIIYSLSGGKPPFEYYRTIM